MGDGPPLVLRTRKLPRDQAATVETSNDWQIGITENEGSQKVWELDTYGSEPG